MGGEGEGWGAKGYINLYCAINNGDKFILTHKWYSIII